MTASRSFAPGFTMRASSRTLGGVTSLTQYRNVYAPGPTPLGVVATGVSNTTS